MIESISVDIVFKTTKLKMGCENLRTYSIFSSIRVVQKLVSTWANDWLNGLIVSVTSEVGCWFCWAASFELASNHFTDVSDT